MFKSLSNNRLGIWSAHGEGKFVLPLDESKYNIISKYSYDLYPANPNGSIVLLLVYALMMEGIMQLCLILKDQYFHGIVLYLNSKITPWIEPFIMQEIGSKRKLNNFFNLNHLFSINYFCNSCVSSYIYNSPQHIKFYQQRKLMIHLQDLHLLILKQ